MLHCTVASSLWSQQMGRGLASLGIFAPTYSPRALRSRKRIPTTPGPRTTCTLAFCLSAITAASRPAVRLLVGIAERNPALAVPSVARQ
jgi:hypothetical protein